METISESDIKLIKDNSWIFTFFGKLPWSTTTILSWVHGDEIFWSISILKILKNIEIVSWKVHFIIWNIRWLETWKRYLDSDMNRMFLESLDENSYEWNRVKEILPFLSESDYLLDIHNTFWPNSKPFLISENEKDLFNVEHVVSWFDKLHSGSSDGYMNSKSSEWYCLEIGSWIWSVILWEESISRFLYYTKNVNLEYPYNLSMCRHNYIFDYLYRTKTNKFKFVKKFKDFDKVKEWQLIWYDWDEEVKAPYNWVIIFAYQPLNKFRLAFCFWKQK